MSYEESVMLLDRDEMIWPFDFRTKGAASFSVGYPPAWLRNVEVDPFPCYAFDLKEVSDALDRTTAFAKLPHGVHVFILPCEDLSRTNAHTMEDWANGHYEGDEYIKPAEDDYYPSIVLSGKRIPPHPAMARYLIPHEYGHAIAGWLAALAGYANRDATKLEADYAKVRGLETGIAHGSGGRWHLSNAEVFANDFRILVCGAEPEFWPHPGIPRPEGIPGLRDWWAERLEQLT